MICINFNNASRLSLSGVSENGGGTVHHVVWDEGLSAQARQYLTALGLESQVKFHVGEAVSTLAANGTMEVRRANVDHHLELMAAAKPHRGSRATSTMGAKVQWTPIAVASTADTRAMRTAAAESKVAPMASGTGKIVRIP